MNLFHDPHKANTHVCVCLGLLCTCMRPVAPKPTNGQAHLNAGIFRDIYRRLVCVCVRCSRIMRHPSCFTNETVELTVALQLGNLVSAIPRFYESNGHVELVHHIWADARYDAFLHFEIHIISVWQMPLPSFLFPSALTSFLRD